MAGAPQDATTAARVATDRLALITKIAVMYHDQGVKQPEIATTLHISQSRVSRALRDAVTLGIVRTVVVPPPGVYLDIERSLVEKYGLLDAVVAEPVSDDESSLLNTLGVAGAAYLETTLRADDRVGLSSWSATLLATVDSMSPRTVRSAGTIVQAIGGVGLPSTQVSATRLADRLAHVTGAEATFLPVPGLVSSRAARDALLADPHVDAVVAAWADLSVLLVGIGSTQPSPMLRESGNAISAADLQFLQAGGAVGDICLRFFDAAGRPVPSELDERILGISVPALRRVPRVIGVAGGPRKYEAIRAAVRGGWVNVLVTDLSTATRLAAEDDAPIPPDES